MSEGGASGSGGPVLAMIVVGAILVAAVGGVAYWYYTPQTQQIEDDVEIIEQLPVAPKNVAP